MTPRERILATLNRQPTDRPPVDVWLTPEILSDLKSHTGVQDELALYHHLGLDKIVWVSPEYPQENPDPNISRKTDAWGVPTFNVKSGAAVYLEYGEGPLAEMEEIEELADYPLWPDPAKFDLSAAREQAQRARDYDFATIGPWVSHFEVYCHLRGMENALMDLVAEPDFVEAALDRIESIQTELLRRVFTELGDLTDLIFISDDLGSQQSQLMSLRDFERHLKPRIARWCALAHQYGKKVLFHTDGASRNYVPHLIEAGVDVLNPIQHICPGMDRAALKRDFGDRIIFHGGVENQQILPYGSVEDVRAETRTCLNTLGDGGGYIVSSCHNIQAGTPIKNVLAMFDEAKTFPSS